MALGYVTVFTTFFAYLFTVYSISTIGPSATGVFTYTQPVFATVIAIVFMNEKLDLIKVVAAVLIFSGVYLANFQKSKTKSQH
jgi:drug/metabolite transporter (DMT)-like permease